MTMPNAACIIPESMMWPSSSTTRETLMDATMGAVGKTIVGQPGNKYG